MEEMNEKQKEDYRKAERKKQLKNILIELSGFAVVGLYILFKTLK